MDYQSELKRLEDNEEHIGGDFWKPEPGQYKVKALSELEDAPPWEEEGKEPQLRAMLSIEVSGKAYTWNFPKGKTPASTYGQITKLGVHHGTLKDKEFSVVVTGKGQSIRFTIVI